MALFGQGDCRQLDCGSDPSKSFKGVEKSFIPGSDHIAGFDKFRFACASSPHEHAEYTIIGIRRSGAADEVLFLQYAASTSGGTPARASIADFLHGPPIKSIV
jgi:hypothetical protein